MYKKSKYNNKITELNGIKFHSKKEALRYSQLKLLEKSGVIKDLQLQVAYELIPKLVINGKTERAIKYLADFVYYENGKLVVEDVKSKGTITDVFKLKYRLMKLNHGIDILLT